MDTSTDIREKLEQILIGDTPKHIRLMFLRKGRTISEADKAVKNTIDSILQVFKEYIEERVKTEMDKEIKETDDKRGFLIEKGIGLLSQSILEGLEKEK